MLAKFGIPHTFILLFLLLCASHVASLSIGVDFGAVEPSTYDHRVGGGSVNLGSDLLTSLSSSSSSFACYDIVSYFLLLDISVAPLGGCLNITLSFDAASSGQPGAAYGDIPSAAIHFGNRSIYENGVSCATSCSSKCPTGCNCTGRGKGNYGYDCAYRGNYNEQLTVAAGPLFTLPIFTKGASLMITLQVCGLDSGEYVPIQVDALLLCLPQSSPTGTIKAALETVMNYLVPVNVGGKNIPLNVGKLIMTNSTCSLDPRRLVGVEFNSTISVFAPSQSNGGSYDMLLWYSWSLGRYKLQTIGPVNRTQLYTFDVNCDYLHPSQTRFTQSTCGCQATRDMSTQPQLFYNANSPYYNPIPVLESMTVRSGTYQVWHYTRATNDSTVTDLYLLRDNATPLRADFDDGSYWVLQPQTYLAGPQNSARIALEWENDATHDLTAVDDGDDVDQDNVLCTCKKKLDIMIVMQRDLMVSAEEYAYVKTLVGVNMPLYTANCGDEYGYQFGFVDPDTEQCNSGVNFGLAYYDGFGTRVILPFEGAIRGTNPAQVNSIANGTSNPCALPEVTASMPCGLGLGNISLAIMDALQALSRSDRSTAIPHVLLVTKGPISSSLESPAIRAAIAIAAGQGVQVDAVVYSSILPASSQSVLATSGQVTLRYSSADLATTSDFFPLYLMALLCSTPGSSECGMCCGECDPTCAKCLNTTMTCPATTNCSWAYRNAETGCCVLDENDFCPFIPGRCTAAPACLTNGQCQYNDTCGTLSTDEPNCYNYNCIADPSSASAPWICQKTKRFADDNCTIRTCLNNTIVSTPKYSCVSDQCFTRACDNSLGGCTVIASSPSPEPSNLCLRCNAATGWTNRTCPAGTPCMPGFCDPTTGGCTSTTITCFKDSYGLCDTTYCENGTCVHIHKTCVPGTCQVGDPTFASTGFCVPATGNCSFIPLACDCRRRCPCGSPRPYETCSLATGNCSCAITCAPSLPPPSSPSLCNCRFDQCGYQECLNPAIGTCSTVTERNCTQEAIDSGVANNHCLRINACDLGDPAGCTFTPITCDTSADTFCKFTVADPTTPGCCRKVSRDCGVSSGCSLRGCNDSTETCTVVNQCHPGTDKCQLPVCNARNLTCTTQPKPCPIPDTMCVKYTCDSATGDCSPSFRQCDDGSLCTTDTCDDVLGCVFTPITCPAPGDLCTSNLACDNTTGTCGTVPKNCDDGIPCTSDYCDTSVGCQHGFSHALCATPDPCISQAQCTSTGCQETATDCGGEDLFCTITFCQENFGCTTEPRNCAPNLTNSSSSCSFSNCSESLKACETVDQNCYSFIGGVVAGVVVAGVVVGVLVAAGATVLGIALSGGFMTYEPPEDNLGVGLNPLYKGMLQPTDINLAAHG